MKSPVFQQTATRRRRQDEIYFLFSAESKLSDVRALLDSYAVEVLKDGLVYRRAPLHSFPLGGGEPRTAPIDPVSWFPSVNKALDVRLCRYAPPSEDFLKGIRERDTRWPFFVVEPLTIQFTWVDQWWEYGFTPGKTYEDRRILPLATELLQ